MFLRLIARYAPRVLHFTAFIFKVYRRWRAVMGELELVVLSGRFTKN